jgi:ligand-binding SRPBCC domain-containing protein
VQNIKLTTSIHAPRERVFDLARSIDAHQASATGTDERAVTGITSGLIGLDDEVTWEARHFGLTQRLSVRVTEFTRPSHFQDVMVKGAFKSMVHDHDFLEQADGTLMTDCFQFASPFGILGRAVDSLFLAGYMQRFIARRNAVLKALAESDTWRQYLAPEKN